MPYQTGVLEAVQDWGFRLHKDGFLGCILTEGYATRGSSSFNPGGSVNHHTGNPNMGDFPSWRILVEGVQQPTQYVPGPLCNAGLSRSACLHMIALGRANHAGKGGWNGLVGNSSVWGLEVEHSGSSSEPVRDEQWEAMHRWHRAVQEFSGFPIGNICQHFEWAPSRKHDFVREVTNPSVFRADVKSLAHLFPTEPEIILEGDMDFTFASSGQPVIYVNSGYGSGLNEGSDLAAVRKMYSDNKVPLGHLVLDAETYNEFVRRYRDHS